MAVVFKPIRLVTLDALHTLLTPRLPIHTQYSQLFAPFLGVLEPDAIRRSFKIALKQLQTENPVYRGLSGVQGWWGEVIKRTAVGAGADPQAVNASLEEIVPKLMARFSSKEGYMLFDDVIPALYHLNKMGVQTALVSNADSRIRLVLEDLNVLHFLKPILLSEEVGVEKPARAIFLGALENCFCDPGKNNCTPQECLHVGDELECDYEGAVNAGMHALLLRRPGSEGDGEGKEGEDLERVQVVKNLWEVVEWVEQRKRQCHNVGRKN